MAGIYIHIPFCKKACHYCNFHFSTSLALKNDFLDALLREIELRKDYTAGETISTIYLGGGTPSLLEKTEIEALLRHLRLYHPIATDAEITLEANPDDISPDKLTAWSKSGINRLSIGVQSFFDEDLAWMNRAHNAGQAIESLSLATQLFPNITIDLIYGMPTLTDQKWQSNVERAIGLNIPHLSCYALTVEPKTALQHLIEKSQVADVNSEDQARQFVLLMDWLTAAGYEHYEISNFALPGMRSKHNSSYWRGEKYLGLGPSAHSFDGHSRQWNIANNAMYIQAIRQGIINYEKEELTAEQRLNEYTMTSLRTIEGLDLARVMTDFGADKSFAIKKTAGKYIEQKLIDEKGERLILTKEGKLFADGIASELFF